MKLKYGFKLKGTFYPKGTEVNFIDKCGYIVVIKLPDCNHYTAIHESEVENVT